MMYRTPLHWFYLLPALALATLAKAPADEPTTAFPYTVTEKTKDRELSAAIRRSFEHYPAPRLEDNELYSQFKYTPLEGLDYHGGDGTVSRRDATKVIRENGKYYVWYTHRNTPTPPKGADECTDTIP